MTVRVRDDWDGVHGTSHPVGTDPIWERRTRRTRPPADAGRRRRRGVHIPANGAPSCATAGRRDGGAVESNAPGSAGCRRGAVAAAAPLLVEAKARRRRR